MNNSLLLCWSPRSHHVFSCAPKTTSLCWVTELRQVSAVRLRSAVNTGWRLRQRLTLWVQNRFALLGGVGLQPANAWQRLKKKKELQRSKKKIFFSVGSETKQSEAKEGAGSGSSTHTHMHTLTNCLCVRFQLFVAPEKTQWKHRLCGSGGGKVGVLPPCQDASHDKLFQLLMWQQNRNTADFWCLWCYPLFYFVCFKH